MFNKFNTECLVDFICKSLLTCYFWRFTLPLFLSKSNVRLGFFSYRLSLIRKDLDDGSIGRS